ncbi:cobyrinic acid a,c-diamide synthase [Humibacillus xanthopallidus]|uniref:Hydrogenobyrinate a,c-diamide synthase n=1 Tax=Humibacillus xanthopallidus TaxID=412689 RepID=A0A543PL58_9MICO|nr:cobyrinate a,c-diamide synthase [Humibacillus xanthopallidus]TQN44811.1 cobyrinic acid a,c-diamide synthase [Humibacillus xanthopallidus]
MTADPARPVTRLPRVVIAAPGSGHGKTTVATGLMAALRAAGHAVGGFKVGPDFIDTGYHALATGRIGRNLDPVLCGEGLIEPLLLHGARAHGRTDVAVIEGVMGLFDGRIGGEGFGSTAHVATLTHTPVVLTVDIGSTTRTAAAVVHGLATFDPTVRVAGVVLNRAGSDRHGAEARSAFEATGVPVLGVLPRDATVSAPSRHLGLVPVQERDDSGAGVERLADLVAAHVDLDALLEIASSAPDLDAHPWDPATVVGGDRPPAGSGGYRPVVAVAGGPAFTFRYAETEELLHAAGLRAVTFDPLTDTVLPPGTSGLFIGGGFPEVHADALSANASLRSAIRRAVWDGLPTVAECGGLVYLCQSVDGSPMVGALPAVATMAPRLTIGYRTAVATTDSVLGEPGRRVTGHEFHRTVCVAAPESASGDGRHTAPAWLLDGVADGFALDPSGAGTATLHASYLHTHWAGHPELARRFADALHARAGALVTDRASERDEVLS